MAFSATITIEELTASGPGLQPRTMTLRGTGMPFKGATWGSQLNVVTTWYQGNGQQATQQVLGPQDPPSSWSGRWSRTLLSREPVSLVDENGQLQELVDPFRIREAFESIQRSGALLRVTFASRGALVENDPRSTDARTRPVDSRIVREGRCKMFQTPIDRATDMNWSMEWEWVGRGVGRKVVSRAKKDQDLASAAADVQASIDALKAIVEGNIAASDKLVMGSANNFTLGRLESISNSVTRSANQIFTKLRFVSGKFAQVSRLQQKLVNTPLGIANAAVDFAQNTQYLAKQYVDQSTRTPAEVASLKSRASDVLRAYRYSFAVETSVSKAASTAYELEARTRQVLAAASLRGANTARMGSATRSSPFLAVRTCRSGDTPQNVSLKYYGTPDHGVDILRANKLPWQTPSFYPGQVIFIPSLTSLSTTVSNGN